MTGKDLILFILNHDLLDVEINGHTIKDLFLTIDETTPNIATFEMPSNNVVVRANFTKPLYTVNITTDPEGIGYVSGKKNYNSLETVELRQYSIVVEILVLIDSYGLVYLFVESISDNLQKICDKNYN